MNRSSSRNGKFLRRQYMKRRQQIGGISAGQILSTPGKERDKVRDLLQRLGLPGGDIDQMLFAIGAQYERKGTSSLAKSFLELSSLALSSPKAAVARVREIMRIFQGGRENSDA